MTVYSKDVGLSLLSFPYTFPFAFYSLPMPIAGTLVKRATPSLIGGGAISVTGVLVKLPKKLVGNASMTIVGILECIKDWIRMTLWKDRELDLRLHGRTLSLTLRDRKLTFTLLPGRK